MKSPAIIIPTQPANLADAKRLITRAAKKADIVEIWLDRVAEPAMIRTVLGYTRKPVIVNLKDKKERGVFRGSAKQRTEILSKALQQISPNPSLQKREVYVDLPLDFPPELIRQFRKEHPQTKLILSWHDFAATPNLKKLRALVKKAQALRADVVKLVGTARSMQDVYAILTIATELQKAKQAFLVMAMGELGAVARVLSPLLGGLGMFAAYDKKSASAPGQLTATELKQWWKDFA